MISLCSFRFLSWHLFSGRSLIIAALLIILSTNHLLAQDTLYHFIDNGGFMVDDGNKDNRYRENDLFIPASTQKILTCLTALEILGPHYRFETHFFLDERNNLYIKGYGDPLLVSETILKIGKKFAALGIKEFTSIHLDDSAFRLWGETAGDDISTNSFDAPNGALAVNFNALLLRVEGNGTLRSGEPQTPMLPMMREIGAKLPPGLHRLNINVVPVAPGKSAMLRYAGELFTAQLRQAGIVLKKPYGFAPVPPNLQPVFIHKGEATLAEIVQQCLKYSNNFIANQLFLASGMHIFGLPATWEKSRETYRKYVTTTLNLSPKNIVIDEGSGLSRSNRVSPAALVQILYSFRPFADLLSRKDSILLKSGTLSDAFCYAGYFEKAEELLPFVVLLNQQKNTRALLLKELQKLSGIVLERD